MNTVPEPSDNWAAIEGAPPTWIPLIPDFTGTPWADRAGYARQAAEWVWLAIGSQQPQDAASREQHVERLTTVILDAYESLSGKVLAHQTFLYIPGPEAPPLPALLGIWKSAGARDERLRYLAGADGHDAIQPPDVEEFSTEHLGSGLRVFSVSKPDEDSAELMGTLAYAFRSEAYQTDIQLRAPSYDLGLLQACADDVDEFARCIFVTPAPGAARG